MSGFLLLAKRQLVHIKMAPTRAAIEKVLDGPAVRLSVHQPGNVSVYCKAESVARRTDPNALATIFCRKHGAVARDETVFGWMVITCDEEHALDIGAPRWVLQDLMDMLPAATELADGGGVRVLN